MDPAKAALLASDAMEKLDSTQQMLELLKIIVENTSGGGGGGASMMSMGGGYDRPRGDAAAVSQRRRGWDVDHPRAAGTSPR